MSGTQGYGPTGGSNRNQTGRSFNKPPKGYGTFNNFTPEQWNVYDKSQEQFSPESQTYRLANGDESYFNELEAPAKRQFGAMQANTASRFSQGGGGAGALGSRHSSGFQNGMSAANSNFAQDLQSQRLGLRRQAIQDLQGMYNDFQQQNPYQLYEKQQKQSSGWGSLAGTVLGSAAGFAFGGPAGAFTGAKIGQSAGSAF
jgi:hypothetical protein